MALVYLSCKAWDETLDIIKSMGHKPVLLGPYDKLYPAVACHADLFLCKLGVCAAAPVFSDQPLGYDYPGCASLCAAANSRYFIHNTSITHPRLLAAAKKAGLEVIHVNQGFTRCNLLAVGEGFITPDKGVAKVLKAATDSEILLISPEGVALEGHDYGFLPGCAGIIDQAVVFNGDLSRHPDFKAIADFIHNMGYEVKYTFGTPLADIGSIIQSEEPISLFAEA